MRPTRGRAGERGSQLVEFALVAPLLVMLALLVIIGGDIARVHQVLNNAAREGARFASGAQDNHNASDAVAEVIAYAADNGVTVNSADVTVDQNATIPISGGINAKASKVSVTHSYSSVFLHYFTWMGIPNGITLNASAEFRNLWVE